MNAEKESSYGGMKPSPLYCVGETCHGFTTANLPCKKKARKCGYYCSSHEQKHGSIHPSQLHRQHQHVVDQSDECPICFESMSKTRCKVEKPTSCGHLMHKRCLAKWLKTHQTCPICRHQLHHTVHIEKPPYETTSQGDTIPEMDEMLHWVTSAIRTVMISLHETAQAAQ